MVTIENRSTDLPQESGETGNDRAPEQSESGNVPSRESGSTRAAPDNSARLEKFESALKRFKNAVQVEERNPEPGFNEPSDEDNDPSVREMRSMARKLAPARPRDDRASGPPVRHIPYSRSNGEWPFLGACLAVLMIGGPIFIGPLLLIDRQAQIREPENSQNLPQPIENEELSSAVPKQEDKAAVKLPPTEVVSSPVQESEVVSTSTISGPVLETKEASTGVVSTPMPETTEVPTEVVTMPEVAESAPVSERTAQPKSATALVSATGGLGLEKETQNTPFVVSHSSAAIVEPISKDTMSSNPKTGIEEDIPEASSANLSDTASDRTAEPIITSAIPKDIVPDDYEKREVRDTTITRSSAVSVEGLLARGHKKLMRGEITAARSLFHRAYKLGDSRGAEGMGMTFDPEVYENIPVAMFSPEVERARYWYEKSRQMSASDKQRSIDEKN